MEKELLLPGAIYTGYYLELACICPELNQMQSHQPCSGKCSPQERWPAPGDSILSVLRGSKRILKGLYIIGKYLSSFHFWLSIFTCSMELFIKPSSQCFGGWWWCAVICLFMFLMVFENLCLSDFKNPRAVLIYSTNFCSNSKEKSFCTGIKPVIILWV